MPSTKSTFKNKNFFKIKVKLSKLKERRVLEYKKRMMSYETKRQNVENVTYRY